MLYWTNFDLANKYFCTFIIQKQCCPNNCTNCFGVTELNPMLLKISSNNLEINKNYNEIFKGKIERKINGCKI